MSKKIKNVNVIDSTKAIENISDNDISTLNWKTLTGEDISDLSNKIEQDILKYQNEGYNKSDFKFIVSCDSQRHGNKVTYVTAIIFLRSGHGGNAYYLKENTIIPNFFEKFETKEMHIKRIQTYARNRIWTECIKAITCAKWLDQILLNFHLKVREIHSDININKKYLSNELLSAVNGYILSQEYTPIIKPNAWGASKIADSKTK